MAAKADLSLAATAGGRGCRNGAEGRVSARIVLLSEEDQRHRWVVSELTSSFARCLAMSVGGRGTVCVRADTPPLVREVSRPRAGRAYRRHIRRWNEATPTPMAMTERMHRPCAALD